MVKKLKLAAKKQAGAKPTASAHSRGSSSSGSSDSDSDDSSEYYSESEPEKEPDEPSPLPPARPVDPNKAVEYDLIKTVWAKRSSVLSGTVIRVALGETWDIFKGIRDKWKAKCTSLQQAVEKKDQANERAFERRVTEQRRLLESCIGLTLTHGHPSIVEKYVYCFLPSFLTPEHICRWEVNSDDNLGLFVIDSFLFIRKQHLALA